MRHSASMSFKQLCIMYLHNSDVIWVASVSIHRQHDYLFNRVFRLSAPWRHHDVSFFIQNSSTNLMAILSRCEWRCYIIDGIMAFQLSCINVTVSSKTSKRPTGQKACSWSKIMGWLTYGALHPVVHDTLLDCYTVRVWWLSLCYVTWSPLDPGIGWCWSLNELLLQI